MRKTEDEIKDREEIESIITRAQVCRVGLAAGNIPYIVPMNFGFQDNCLYFHCATQGQKLDMIRRNDQVCFEIDIEDRIVKAAGSVCSWTSRYRSVIGFGKASIIETWPEKSKALNIITRHYGADPQEFTEKELERVGIIKIEISSMTGKKLGY